MRKVLLILAAGLLSLKVCAQLPDTDIWMLDVRDSAGIIAFSNPLNITNRKGYDNQPAFSPDGSYILFSSQRGDSSSPTDIYRYDIASRQTSQFTNTATSEFSPTFLPGGKGISVVMVEKDSAQRLWKFPLKGGSKARLLTDKIDSIGYHCWYNKNTLGLFVLTTPSFTLQVAQLPNQNTRVLADSIGRCMKMQGSFMYFTVKTLEGKNRLYWFLYPGLHTEYTGVTIDSEDYDFLLKNTILYCTGSNVNSINLTEKTNRKLVNLEAWGISKVSRLVISPDGKRVLLVSNN